MLDVVVYEAHIASPTDFHAGEESVFSSSVPDKQREDAAKAQEEQEKY